MICKFWIGVAIVVSVSIGITFFAPISEIYKGVAAVPAIGGLLAALFQLLRDQALHEKRVALQAKQNLFNLGATSHMANTVFDKHVEFSEKYLAEVTEVVITLTREGPTTSALEHSGKLYQIRVDYTAWITPEIEDQLMPFEKAIRQIGAKAHFIDMISGSDAREESRLQAVREIHDTFANLMEFESEGPKDEASTIKAIKNRVRDILGVRELVSVRDFLVKEAENIASKS